MLKRPELRDLSQEISGADDDKIRRIVAFMDQQPIPDAAQAILDPLRPRLAFLRPPRPLRFARLLFLPLDPVIVPAPVWRVGDAAVPRGALMPIAETVRAGLGHDAEEIDAMIAGRDTRDEAIIANAGAWLWSCAGTILAAVPNPVGWEAAGLPLPVFAPLAQAIGSVLQRAAALRDLERGSAFGTTGPNDDAVRGILAGLTAQTPEGLNLMVALLLLRLPHAVPQLQRLITLARGSADGAALRQAMDRGVDGILSEMGDNTGFDSQILRGPLRDAGQEVQRVAALLSDIENEPDAAKHRPRLKAIWQKLDQTCRKRFGDGLAEDVVTPLMSAAGPLTAADQIGMEAHIRELRGLEAAARKFAGGKMYDALLGQAATVARKAADTGVLTPVRHMRLVEILDGPEAAEALYQGSGRAL